MDDESPTDLLLSAGAGDPAAAERVYALVYEELRRRAHAYLQQESDGHTLATTDLVHEAYLRLIDQTRVQWTGRAHFMAVAATAMRRILVDHARRHQSLKHGGGLRRVPLEFADFAVDQPADLLVALDDALDRLRTLAPRQAQVVEYQFFGGMSQAEVAATLGIGLRTAKREWARARSWLYMQIHPDDAA
jgi:RNA polymerase sigma-70 factor, ECF subfamily